MSEQIKQLQDYLEKIAQYTHVITLLEWDLRTGTPKKGADRHIDAYTYFSTELFQMTTDERFGKLLDDIYDSEEYQTLSPQMQVTVYRKRRDFHKNKNIPKDFYEAFVRESSTSQNAWEEAKEKSDYEIFKPHLKKLIAMKKEMCSYTDPDMEVYDAMLNTFEEGMDSKTIDKLFDELKEGLLPLLKAILAKEEPDTKQFQGYYDINQQKKACEMLLDYIGFDFERGTSAESVHPFTLNFSMNDVRVTNEFKDDEAINAMFSAIHEGGHAIFEQHVNPDFEKTEAGNICFLGLHESQSRFYENILGRNKNFWVPIYNKLGEILPKFKDISLDDFVREINHVRNSFIRTDADELTYNFHIILRYEMEKAIFRDGKDVDELPELWNQKMEEYLSVRPENDAEGILQDTHWSDGSFGYFPSYLLGTIYDGMFLEALQDELGDVETILREGRILEITKWLNDKIHQYGGLRLPKDVLEQVCHKEVTVKPILKYFTDKYTKIYSL